MKSDTVIGLILISFTASALVLGWTDGVEGVRAAPAAACMFHFVGGFFVAFGTWLILKD